MSTDVVAVEDFTSLFTTDATNCEIQQDKIIIISPQDQVMYKPFVTCDDPKGVVECGTIRRYRTSSRKMKDKTSGRRTAENSERNKPDKEEKVSKGSTERSFDPSSLQLVEVSRGAEKLNNMIESWTRGMRYDERSEDIAKDLLKGALDLQESLEVLRKVQEASHNMSRSNSKRKQDEKPERNRIDAKLMDRTIHSNQLGDQSYPMRFQIQRGCTSADCSSSSCREELKKVIKESLVRENLLPSTSSEGLDSASAFASTNSSQSSVVWNDKLSDSSFSPTFSRKERGTNLVAKLMGLEEIPSRSFPPVIMQKQLESQKILNQKRPVFEIDKLNTRKNSSKFEKVNPERQQTLRDILETTHFNGLLKSPIRENKVHVHHSNDLHYKQLNDLPPIVLMKPRYTPYQEFVKTCEPSPPEDSSFRNLKTKTVSSKTFKPREEGSTTNMRNEMEEHVFKRFTKEERTKPFKEVGKEMEEHVSKRFTREGRTKHFKEVVEMDVKEIKSVENEKAQGGDVKLYSHASHRLQRNETVDRKAKAKTITISRKPPEKEVSKSRIVTKTHDQGEIGSTGAKLRKPQSGSRISRSEIPSRKNIISNSNTISKPKSKKIDSSKELRKSLMKKQVSVAEAEAAKPIDEQVGREEGRSIDVPCKDDCAEIKIITTITDSLTMGHDAEAYENKTIENCEQNQNSSADDVMMLKYEHENDAIPTEEAHETTSISGIDTMPEKDSADSTSEIDFKTDKGSAELKYLLLTSQSFIDHAEELLNLDVDFPKILPKVETSGISNIRLYLDCANEITEHKSLQESQVVHPLLLTCAGNSRKHISLGKLVEEVYNAIEILASYSENSEKKLILDSILSMMERDIKCNNGLINGIWNWGWKHGFSSDEAEQVVNDIENLVLGGLIEEVIVNL